jgi:hypothetical protein
MPVRLGQFYAFVLLLTCLAINIAFFSEVREPFLGDEDPLASVKSAFAELNIQANLADFYPKVQSKVDSLQDVTPPVTPAPKKANPVPTEPESVVPIVDPFQFATPPPKVEHKIPTEEPAPPAPLIAPSENLQTAATMPVPQPAAAVAKPVIADQFKPMMTEPKPIVPVNSVKPSSTPVWETIDTVLERPIWQ